MRLKRKDKLRKALAFYQRVFGFRTPLKIVVDADFLFAALKAGMHVFEVITKFFDEHEIRLFTTPCVKQQVTKLSETPGPFTNDWRGVLQILNNKKNQFQYLRCTHKKEHLNGHQCLLHSLSATSTDFSSNGQDAELKNGKPTWNKNQKPNANKLILCGQHSELRETARTIPGVPIVFIQSNFLIMEDPSPASEQFGLRLKRVQEHHTSASAETGLDVIQRLAQMAPVKVDNLDKLAEQFAQKTTQLSGGEYKVLKKSEDKDNGKPKMKKKKPTNVGPDGKPIKNPNPLSCKKSTKPQPSVKKDKKAADGDDSTKKQNTKRQKTNDNNNNNKSGQELVQLPKPQQTTAQPQQTNEQSQKDDGEQQKTGKKRKRYKKKAGDKDNENTNDGGSD